MFASLLVGVASASLLVGCGTSRHSPSKAASTTSASSATTAAQSSKRVTSNTNIASAMLDYLFPRSGADFASGMQVHYFELAQEQKATTSCMTANGFPPAPTQIFPPIKYGSGELPNLPLIQRTLAIGVTVVLHAPKNPLVGMSKAEAAAYNAQFNKCTAKPTLPILAFVAKGSTQALVQEWENITEATIASAPVERLNRKAASCSSSTHFPATSVQDEMTKIGNDVTPLTIKLQAAAARATEKAGVQVLVRCFGQEIELTSRLLAKRRAAFFSQNAQAIDEIEAEANRATGTPGGHVRKTDHT